MKRRPKSLAGPRPRWVSPALVLYWWLAGQGPVAASIFQGETLDAIANAISWIVLIVAPVIGITVFWLVHILPEKIAEKKHHPQAKAIQCLCLLSLCFGGLLWPLAWLWAYTKPVLHKLAYGTETDTAHQPVAAEPRKPEVTSEATSEAEMKRLRDRVAELENPNPRKKGGRA